MPTNPGAQVTAAGSVARDTSSLGCRLTLSVGQGLAQRVASWAKSGRSGYVCVANTHQVVQAQAGSELHDALQNALAVTSDSQVLGKALQRLGTPYPEPVLYGPDLMQAVIAQAEKNQLTVALFGSTEQVCQAVCARIAQEHPALSIAGSVCPPVSSLDDLVTGDHAAELRAMKADIVLVSLGCPKQELWMYRSANSLPGVSIGLGGAFGFYADQSTRSPAWVHKTGLEWLYRLCSEPQRLYKRYLVNNPLFVWIWLKARLRGNSNPNGTKTASGANAGEASQKHQP